MRTLILLFLVLSLGGASTLSAILDRVSTLEVPGAQYGLVHEAILPTTILFGGDIMLGRSVEVLIEEEGYEYPFSNISEFISGFDIAVANFEGSIPETHVPTEPLQMRFSIKDEYMGILKAAGFDVLSLGNNHALDYGPDGYEHTKSVCATYSILCFGTPLEATSTSIAVVVHNDTRIGILSLHTLFRETDPDTLRALVESLTVESDVQVAFIHWGEEYALSHSDAQAALAYTLIDAGIDAVVGHHPHVIQDVEKYRGKPIFYSLGNLIFDQYFDTEVQRGYLLGMSIDERDITYTLYPYETETQRSQPQFMSEEAAGEVRERILPKTIFRDEEVSEGRFIIPRDTALE